MYNNYRESSVYYNDPIVSTEGLGSESTSTYATKLPLTHRISKMPRTIPDTSGTHFAISLS